MIRRCRYLLLCLALAVTGDVAWALVEPESTAHPPQGWMVNIYVVGPNDFRNFFCKGALIAPRWVLTAARCLYDPYKAVEGSFDDGDPEYVVIASGSSKPVKVRAFKQSADFTVGLMHLEAPLDAEPLRIGGSKEAQLIDSDVFIVGTERSKAIRDSRFNPDRGLRMDCDMDGSTFFTGSTATGGALCYLMSRPESGSTLYRVGARVVDPNAPGVIRSPLDLLGGSFDRSGARLYLDFQAGGYPCHEDLGAPVLRTTPDGGVEAVGLVAAVGVAAGLPICGPSLFNTFTSLVHHRDFLLETLAAGMFDALCPTQPELQLEQAPAGGAIRLYWSAVAGARGYRLFFTPHAGHVPIETLDIGDVTEFATILPEQASYTVAVAAYTDDCAGPPSAPLPVTRDQAR